MALTLQDRFSKMVDAKLRASIIQKNALVWNSRYEGDPKAGAVKIPVRDTEVKAAAYNKENGATKTYTSGTFLNVPIDKDYAVNEVLDGYAADAVPDNIAADRLDSAGYSLAMQMNSDGTDELLKGTVAESTTALTEKTVYNDIVDNAGKLDDINVPDDGRRFIICTPAIYRMITKAPEFIKASNLGDAVVQSGALGEIAGLKVIKDSTLNGKTVKGSQNVEYVIGHPDWCCRVEEWAVAPRVQSLDGSGTYIGASAIQGRKVYAHKLTKTQTVIIKSAAGK